MITREFRRAVMRVVAPGTWIAPTLLNSWVNYGGANNPIAGYYKDALGIVHIRGIVKDGTIGSVPVFTLPSGYRPAYDFHFAAMSNETPQGYLRVETNGDVEAVAGSNVWFSLACSFRAEA